MRIFSLHNTLPSNPALRHHLKPHPRQAILQSCQIGRAQCWPFMDSIRINGVPKVQIKGDLIKTLASAPDVSPEQELEEPNLPKGWSVHKFGGTCMGSSVQIQNVANIILRDPSERKLIIVSAMPEATDMLYALINKAKSRSDSYLSALDEVFDKHKNIAKALLEVEDLAQFLARLLIDCRNLTIVLDAIFAVGYAAESFTDYVVGYGELWSAQILSYAIKKSGQPCSLMNTRDVLVNPAGSDQLDPNYPKSEEKLKEWFSSHNPAGMIIATGFIENTVDNILTTLKRDGNDFSAAIFGALLRARKVTIWTDADGVYSADPRKVGEAVILPTLSYREACEMIPIVIRNIFNLSAPGTVICEQPIDETAHNKKSGMIKAFTTIDSLALVNIEGTGMAGVPGTASAIFSTVKDVRANVIMISQASSEHSICFAVPEKEVEAVSAALHSRFRQALEAGGLSKVEVIHNCCILAAVGQRMASTPGVSYALFGALAKANINVRAIAQGCSEYNITVVLKQEDCIRALRAAHSLFYDGPGLEPR